MDIYKSNSSPTQSSRKRKFGLISLVVFLICSLGVALSISFDQSIRQLFSDGGYRVYGNLMTFLVFLGALSLLFSTTLFKSKILKVIFWLILGPILLFLLIYIFVLRPHKVKGDSMAPNVINNEFVLGSSLAYQFKSPQRGDIVIFMAPDTGGESIDRIIGLPGESISIRSGQVYINSKRLDEPYLPSNIKTTPGPSISDKDAVIPLDQYAVMGDNRDHSGDSRYYGFVDEDDIREKVFYTYWPSDRSGFIKQNALLVTPSPLPAFKSCRTLGTKMVRDDSKGQIGCDIVVDGWIDLSESYCESQTTHIKKLLLPDAYKRPNKYFATLVGLDTTEEVKVFVRTNTGSTVECLPSLNR